MGCQGVFVTKGLECFYGYVMPPLRLPERKTRSLVDIEVVINDECQERIDCSRHLREFPSADTHDLYQLLISRRSP